MSNRYGATDSQWQLLIDAGLAGDLLPVVSKPGMPISPRSTLKETGKVPSVLNVQNEVVGIPGWNDMIVSERDIDRWRSKAEYGVCIRTKHLRAFDIDVPDAAAAQKIEDLIQKHHLMPVRSRRDSGKRLLACFIEGDLAKRVIKVDGGIVEFLAEGQQFIAFGMHQKGAMYEWTPAEPTFPTVDSVEFELIWAEIVAAFAIEPESRAGTTKRKPKTEGDIVEDGLLEWLEANSLVLSWGKEGQAFIKCPYADGHTSESSETSTAYFPAGSRGYANGHFKCLHAHCAGYSDTDFEWKLGYADSQLADMPVEVSAEGQVAEVISPKVSRNSKGKIETSMPNLLAAALAPQFCGFVFGYDDFKGEIVYSPWGETGWRPFSDEVATDFRINIERRGFLKTTVQDCREVILKAARANQFDSGRDWLTSLRWDGNSRVARFFELYCNSKNIKVANDASMYLWTALAGRIMSPGCQADIVPVLVGRQGTRKTSLCRVIPPSLDYYLPLHLGDNDADISRKMRGALVVELDELRGLSSRDASTLKSFITRTREEWIEKYKTTKSSYPRRSIFIGTTNESEFLDDATGNRRWLPVPVGNIDTDGVERDRNQLWAEALYLWREHGIIWKGAEERSWEAPEQYSIIDPWSECIYEWLHLPDTDGKRPIDTYIKANDVAIFALGMSKERLDRRMQIRVANCLKRLGLEKFDNPAGLPGGKYWAKIVGQGSGRVETAA